MTERPRIYNLAWHRKHIPDAERFLVYVLVPVWLGAFSGSIELETVSSARQEALAVVPILDSLGIAPAARERKLLAKVVEKGSEAALLELTIALRLKTLAPPRPT